MDLAACAREVCVIMEHTTRKGGPRLVEACTLPLTAMRCVTRVYTDLAVVDVTPKGFVVSDILDGLTHTQLRERTDAPLTFAPDCRVLAPPPLPDAE
jgi:3-oxoadipate CoA-transferase beta subunit